MADSSLKVFRLPRPCEGTRPVALIYAVLWLEGIAELSASALDLGQASKLRFRRQHFV
jgi:hypothetical protein